MTRRVLFIIQRLQRSLAHTRMDPDALFRCGRGASSAAAGVPRGPEQLMWLLTTMPGALPHEDARDLTDFFTGVHGLVDVEELVWWVDNVRTGTRAPS